MLNILIISGNFFPSNTPRAFRTTELAKELACQGHKVTVLIPEKQIDYSDFQDQCNIKIETYNLTWKKEIVIGEKPSSIYNRILNRFLQLMLEYPNIEITHRLSKLLINKKGFDLLISIAVPHPVHWGVAKAISKNHELCKTWIADCGDPYWASNSYTNILNRHPFYFKYIENRSFKKTDFITVPTNNSIKAYDVKFHSKIKVIPQGFNFDEMQIDKTEPQNNPITFAYAGGVNKIYRNPIQFLEYLSTMDKDFRFVFYTNNNGYNLVKPFKAKLKSKLEIKDAIPRHELLIELAKMNFLVNFENVMDTQTPSKIIDYSLVSRPILSVNTKKLNIEIIDEFINQNYSNQLIIDDIENYNIINVAKEFINLHYKNIISLSNEF